MTKNEVREGAQGVSNAARESNITRYDIGRIGYHAQRAMLTANDEERGTLEMILDAVSEMNDNRPLEAGEEGAALLTRKSKGKAKESQRGDE